MNHGGDDAFGVASRAPVDIGFVFARPEKRRHRIHVRRERDRRRLAPAGEHVVPPRLDLDALDLAAIPRRQGRQVVVQVLAHPLLILGDGFDIDQRARELENVHNDGHSSMLPCGDAGRGKSARARRRAFYPDSAPPDWDRVTVSRY
jgi:hypothetical protein